MPWELRIDTHIKADMLDCDEAAREEIRGFVSALEDNAYPVGSEKLGPLSFFTQLRSGYFISWEAVLDPSKPPSITDPPLAAVRVLGVGKNSPLKRQVQHVRKRS